MYDGPTYFAWFVLTLLFFIVVGLIVWLGSMPRKLALKRNNPQVDAINACSWWGLAFGGIGWMIAFVWAMAKINPEKASGQESASTYPAHDQLVARVELLEKELQIVREHIKPNS